MTRLRASVAPLLLIAFAAAVQLIPHAWNVTSIGAVGLYAGARFKPRLAWTIPIAALLIADATLGFYVPIVMGFVYLGYLAGPVVGHVMLRTRRSYARLGGAVGCSATVFFLVSNIGNWLAFSPHTGDGLIECYVRGLPLLAASLLGDGLYTAAFFGVEALMPQRRASAHAVLST